jgi:hypothetical protein
VSELRGTEYVNRRVIQIPSTREINNGNFFRSDQTFRFNIAGNSWWSPAQSYFKIRSSLKKPTGRPLTGADHLAPSFCFMDCMYRSASFSMNGIRVSTINDYMPQIAGLKYRHGKSKDYRRGVGNSLAFYDTDFYRRQSRVITDGDDVDEIKYESLTYTDLGFAVTDTIAFATGAGLRGIITINKTNAGDNPSLPAGDILYFTGTTVGGGGPVLDQQACRIIGQIRNAGVAQNATSQYRVESVVTNALTASDPVAMNAAVLVVRRRLPKKTSSYGNFECIWMPPLGISDCAHYLPSGQYEITLSPQQQETAYKLAIESDNGVDKVAGTDFVLTMDSLELYVVTVEQARVDSLDYLLDLKEITCVPFTITNNTWTSNMLVVPPSTSRLSVAYQDTRVTTGVQYPITKFIVDTDNKQNLINRFNITYANVVYPSNDLDLKLDFKDEQNVANPAASLVRTQHMATAYNDMLLANGSAFSDTTSETLTEWLENGFYLSYPTFKEAKDTSTQVVVKQSFSAVVPNTQLLLFASYNTITSVSIKSGQVVSVSTVEA